MNRTIRLLLFSSIFVDTGFGFVEPILAIFIKDNLVGGTIVAAGVASTLFLITKSAIQLPFSRYVDKHDDKVKWLLVGTFLMAIVPFLYIFAKNIYLVYIAQIIYGIGSGLSYPTWLGLWSINLDKRHESFEWSMYSTVVGVGTAITATAGAAVAQYINFTAAFVMVGIMTIIGALMLLRLENEHNTKLLSK